MCRWGCTTVDTTHMCRWCGTRYCSECLRGDFLGVMKSSDVCRKCFQSQCRGQRVEFVQKPSPNPSERRPKSNSRKSERSAKKTTSGAKKKPGKKRRR